MVPAIVFSIDIDIISYHAPGYGSQNGEGSNSSVSTIPYRFFFRKSSKIGLSISIVMKIMLTLPLPSASGSAGRPDCAYMGAVRVDVITES